MEYLQSLETQRSLRIAVVPIGNTREDVVITVQRQLSSRRCFFRLETSSVAQCR